MLYQEYLKKEILQIVKKLIKKKNLVIDFINEKNFSLEISQKKEFGDLSSNVALVLSSNFKTSPENLANQISIELREKEFISNVEVVKPGFINIFLKNSFWHLQLKNFLNLNGNYEYNVKKKSICVEFVSANPTGLMHIGHARGAVFGDVLCAILEEVGHKITREYYINDAGEQIKKLLETIKFHLINDFASKDNLPENLYPGEYLRNVAEILVKKSSIKKDNNISFYTNEILKIILNDIKKDLKTLGVKHDNFVSEKKITSKTKIKSLISELTKLNLAYYGFQQKPKNINDNDWKQEEQFLFRSKKFGDDSDRALLKPNGEITYFMSDILYHIQKIEQNFDILINVWGVDHFGYVKRLKNALSAINKKKVELEIKLTSLVNLMKNKQKLKMSKRQGNYITMRDVIDKVGVDALRFMMISRNSDKTIDFDFELLQKKNKDNQVFYVQYAYARCMSILNLSKEKIERIENVDFDFKALNLYEEKMIIKFLCSFFNVIKSAAEHYEPHRITNFLYDLSKIFHFYWGLGKIDKNKRIITENTNLTHSRLILVKAISLTLKKGLKLLQISYPENM